MEGLSCCKGGAGCSLQLQLQLLLPKTATTTATATTTMTSTLHFTTLQLQLHYTTFHYMTITTPLHYSTLQLHLHYTTLHLAVVVEVTTATIATTPKTKLQPPFGPSTDSLCHPCITTTHLSYSVLFLNFCHHLVQYHWYKIPVQDLYERSLGRIAFV